MGFREFRSCGADIYGRSAWRGLSELKPINLGFQKRAIQFGTSIELKEACQFVSTKMLSCESQGPKID